MYRDRELPTITEAIEALDNYKEVFVTLNELSSPINVCWSDIIEWNGGISQLVDEFDEEVYAIDSGNPEEAAAMADFVEYVEDNWEVVEELLTASQEELAVIA